MINVREAVMEKFFLFCASTSILALLLICIFLFANGIPAIQEVGVRAFLLGTEWAPLRQYPATPQFGILPMIVGSIYFMIGAIIIGVPVGIFTAIFFAYMCPDKLYFFLKPVVNLLAGIPSVVYGFFGIVVIVPIVRVLAIQFTGHLPGGASGMSILSASILLGIMILPTIIAISESAIRAVPKNYYEGALALGASHTRSVFFVIVPAAKSGILASVILGIGRAIGETMAVVMVAGNHARMPIHALRGARSLTANIVMEMGYASGLHRETLIASAVVLFVFILLINLTFTFIARKSGM
ncbi:MAG: phosphate ABC transporter permease subunit PstC [Defluviitaleaceae bacterium]|nr:phosphate ABC transporter permease subunit PstC [Defluviitaleaceae bacterium]